MPFSIRSRIMASSATIVTLSSRCLVLMLLVSQVAHALVSEGEVLMRFTSHMTDPYGIVFNSYWTLYNDPEPCGQPTSTYNRFPWRGVTCSNDSEGRPTVTGLDLVTRQLSGSISTDLAGLKNLRSLSLAGNLFTGQIPNNIADLQNLEWLDLSDNMLTGNLPKLPSSLLFLDARNNLLSGDLSLTNLFNLSLSSLDLSSNHFTGKLPVQFKETRLGLRLNHFVLSHNQLEGRLPLDLGDLHYFAFCDLSNNSFEGEIPDGPYDPVAGYVYFDLSANKLTGSIPYQLLMIKDEDGIWSFPRYINLSRNSLSGMIDLTSSALGNINFLDLSFNEMENTDDLEFGSPMVERLGYLDLRNNRFSGSLDRIFQGNFSHLRELRVGGNDFGNSKLPFTSADFSFPRLEVMDLSGSGLNGEISSDVFGNENLPSLRVLDLSSNNLHGTIPASLTLMPELRELRLGKNSLEGGIPLDGNWTNLEVLDLSHNSFHFDGAEIQAILGKFTNLRELRLGGSNSNRNRTFLPATVGHLSSNFLELLDLSSCNLIGHIPVELISTDLLPSLKYLNLSSNSLEGSLPEEVGRMRELTELDVSSNKLSGKLPSFQYRLFDPTSFAGNHGLCGPPLPGCPRSVILAIWKILVIVVAIVIVSGGSCLFLGWMWRRNVFAKRQSQDAELIATLLDTDTTSLMSLRELRKATDDFSDENQIGFGGFGTVYKGVLQDGTVVAIKKSKRDGSTSEDKSQFLNEVRILSQVHHRNLVRLLGCCLAYRNALLVFEFVSNGTLEEHLHRKQRRAPLNWNQRLIIAIQTAGALDYLHSSANPPIYHLDVKSANILIDHNLNAKVTDFGISKLAPATDVTHISTYHGLQGTFGYLDPELVVKSKLTGKSDVYAFGVVLLELVTAKTVLEGSRGEDVSLVKWAERLIPKGRYDEIIDPFILDTFHTADGMESINAVTGLAQMCLQFRSEDRPTMREVSAELLNIVHKSPPSISRWSSVDRHEKSDIEMSSSVKGYTI